MVGKIGSKKLIASSTFTADIYQIERQFGFMDRIQTYQTPDFVDTYGSNWFVGIIPPLPTINDTDKAFVSLQSNSEKILLHPGSAVFLPPYSIAQWTIHSSPVRWLAFMGNFNLPPELKHKRFYFSIKNLEYPKNRDQFVPWLVAHYGHSRSLTEQNRTSAVAEQLKNLIDCEFQNELTISQMAHQLNKSRVVLSRAFTQAYGLSPVEYRNKLRIFEGIRFFSSYDRISDVSSFSGFKHQGQYIRSFKTYLGTTPKTYATKS